MKLITLGRLELLESTFQRSKPLMLLVYLSVEGKQSREHLAELFWQRGDMRMRRNNLSRTLSDLRKYAPESFGADEGAVWSQVASDVSEFRQALAAEDYAHAAELYQGPFLAGHLAGWGIELEEWLYKQRDQLAESAQEALLSLAEQAASKDSGGAVQQARAAFRLAEPRADMLARFHSLFEGRDRGLAREVQDLARGYGILLETLAPKPAAASSASQASVEPLTKRHNLPSKGTSFVGRDAELGEVTQQLLQAGCRLLSITGIGGMGKSRLAVQAAYELLQTPHFDGIYYVRLDALTSYTLIPSSVAESLGQQLTGQGDPLEQLASLIADKKLLLILDNFEHLLDGAVLLPKLLQACPQLKLLVTSRERLDLEEEWVFPLEGLTLPNEGSSFEDAQYFDAVQLFTQRAYQAQLTFELRSEDTAHVLELCRLVAGSPLALELAATWVTLLSPKDLVQELKSNLDVLSAKTRNRTERHKSLRAVFEYSWQLLTPQEQAVLKKLSVFRGGFTREAAAEVAEASLGILASLVNKSLLKVMPDKRYDRHPLLYQYTQEKLMANAAEYEQLQKEHFEFFLELAEKSRPSLKGPKQQKWFARLEQDHDNFRAALKWALSGATPEKALSLSGALWWFWYNRGYFVEGRDWLEKALALPDASSTNALGQVLKGASCIASQQGDYELAIGYSTKSLKIYRSLGQTRDIAALLNNLGGINYYLGRYDSATDNYEEALVMCQSFGGDRGTALAYQNLGMLAFAQEQPEKAASYYADSLKIFEKIGGRQEVAACLVDLGKAQLELKNYKLARDLLSRGLAVLRECAQGLNIAYALYILGTLEGREGNYTEAYTHYIQALEVLRKLGRPFLLPVILESCALLSMKRRESARAARLIGAVEAYREISGTPRPSSEQREFDTAHHDLAKQLSHCELTSALEEGRKMTLEQAISYATEQVPNEVQ